MYGLFLLTCIKRFEENDFSILVPKLFNCNVLNNIVDELKTF